MSIEATNSNVGIVQLPGSKWELENLLNSIRNGGVPVRIEFDGKGDILVQIKDITYSGYGLTIVETIHNALLTVIKETE